MKPTNYIDDKKQILEQARAKSYAVINSAMVEAYLSSIWKKVLKNLSKELTVSLGKGFFTKKYS